MQKLVTEFLPADVTFAREARDALVDMCVEFVHLLSSESNDVCEREQKKTISAEHVLRALQELGFPQFAPQIEKVMEEHRVAVKARERKVNKFESSGLSQEELLRQQEELLAQARSRFAQREESSRQEEMHRRESEAAAAAAAAARPGVQVKQELEVVKEEAGRRPIPEQAVAGGQTPKAEPQPVAAVKQEPRRGSSIMDLLN